VRRLISDAVQVKPPLPPETLILEHIDPAKALRDHLPTEAEVREAAMKLTRQIKDTISARTAGQEGWTIGDLEMTMLDLDMGEVALRGTVIIERKD
jgi:hypothetical protein